MIWYPSKQRPYNLNIIQVYKTRSQKREILTGITDGYYHIHNQQNPKFREK